jgi:2-amino-4-hydroxy-6-hydroxymethyldihydropteridine diphosphokinase
VPRADANLEQYALIALGSNLGDSRKQIERAFEKLQGFSTRSIVRSSVWRSTPVDCPPGSPLFLNAVVALLPLPDETPESLLEKLQGTEKAFGRTPKLVVNEARPLDLDLIAFAQQVRNSAQLTLPHPRAHQRRFVLQPLDEIAPDLILPRQTRTVRQLLEELVSDETVVRVQ